MALKLANNATSTLSANALTTDTTIAIQTADAGLFPTLAAGDWFPVTVINASGAMEIMKVTARSAGTLTVTRAQEGTTALAWNAGDRVDLRITWAALLDLLTPIANQLLSTRGDILVRGSAGAQRLALGSAGLPLRSDGTDLGFGTLVAAAFASGPGIITPAMMANGAALSLLGVTGSSGAARADIAAASDDTLLRRVSSALGFGQLTAGMVPAALITYAMMASAAVSGTGDYRAATASKLLSSAQVWADAAFKALTDATTIAIDMSTMVALASVALAGNRTLGNPSNTKVGQFFCFKFTATTSTRTLSLGSSYVLPSAGVESFPISIATTETVYVCGFVEDSTHLRITGVVRY